MATAAKEVRFLAVARKADKVILASRVHTADKAYDFVSNVTKVLTSPGWASVTTDKLSLDDGPHMFYVLIDEVRGCGRSCGAWAAAMCWPLCACGAERGVGVGVWRNRNRSPRRLHSQAGVSQAGRVYIAITTKGYPSRYIYGTADGSTKGILQGEAVRERG